MGIVSENIKDYYLVIDNKGSVSLCDELAHNDTNSDIYILKVDFDTKEVSVKLAYMYLKTTNEKEER